MSVPSNSILIAIEGINGAGKTTQVVMLRSALESIGQEVVTSKEPTTGKWGRIIRESATTGRHSVEDELELFIKDRTEHIADLVKATVGAWGCRLAAHKSESAVRRSFRRVAERFMNDSDKHFSEAAWCDFVRQLVAADQRTQMQAHMDAGCAECIQSYNVWVQVAQIAAPEAENEPPQDGIQSVKSAFRRNRGTTAERNGNHQHDRPEHGVLWPARRNRRLLLTES